MGNYTDIFPLAVQGSQGFPIELLRGLHFLIDPELSSMVIDSGNYVSWIDASGYTGIASGSYRPTYSATGFNGKPAFYFTGGQYWNFGDALENSNGNAISGNTAKYTILSVFKKTGNQNARTIIFSKYGAGAGGPLLEIKDSNKIGFSTRGPNDENILTIESNSTFYNAPSLAVLTFDYTLSPNTSKVNLRVNGVSQAITYTVSGTGLAVHTGFPIYVGRLGIDGAEFWFYGYIKNLVVWNRVLTQNEITLAESYFNGLAGTFF